MKNLNLVKIYMNNQLLYQDYLWEKKQMMIIIIIHK